jgi:hypothetical protein
MSNDTEHQQTPTDKRSSGRRPGGAWAGPIDAWAPRRGRHVSVPMSMRVTAVDTDEARREAAAVPAQWLDYRITAEYIDVTDP